MIKGGGARAVPSKMMFTWAQMLKSGSVAKTFVNDKRSYSGRTYAASA